MKDTEYETKCSNCGKSLLFYEDALCLTTCFFCRQHTDHAFHIESSHPLSCATIRHLIEVCQGKPFETRKIAGQVFDLYRLETSKIIFFAVRRNNYERITWLSPSEVENFIANSIIDELIQKEKENE